MGRTSNAREKLLSAALELIWEQSYYSVGVEAICKRAGVRKGTFYHFFSSKAELSALAIELHWQEHKTLLDSIFKGHLGPLEKIDCYFRKAYDFQKEHKRRTSTVCGCPYFNLGIEISALEPAISLRIATVIDQYLEYFKSVVRDVYALGSITSIDVDLVARRLLNYFEGTLMMSRICNDPELLLDLPAGARNLLGADGGNN